MSGEFLACFLDHEFIFPVENRPFLPRLLKKRDSFVLIIINGFCPTLAADSPDILCQFPMKGNGKHKKENI